MINKKAFCPYIRTAMHSIISWPYALRERVIFDYEIIYVRDGKCRITFGEKSVVVKKNDVVFIRPGERHSFETCDGCDFVQPHIHFDLVYTDKSEITPISFKPPEDMDASELALISDDLLCEIAIPHVFVPADPERFKRLFFEVIEIYSSKPHNFELLYKAAMLELLDCVMSQFETGSTGTNDTISNSVAAVKGFIDANFSSPLSLDLLSLQFHLNKYTMMRNFKAMYGKNIMLYYREKRAERACELLKNTDLAVGSVAQKLGFSDIYVFSRFFKSEVGMSPSDYRTK